MQKIKKAIVQNNKKMTYDFLNNIQGDFISADRLSDKYQKLLSKVFNSGQMHVNPLLNSGTVIIQQTQESPFVMPDNKNLLTLFIICPFQCVEESEHLIWTMKCGFYNYSTSKKESFLDAKKHINKTIKSGVFEAPPDHNTQYIGEISFKTDKVFKVDQQGKIYMQDAFLCLGFENSTTNVLERRGYDENYINRYLQENTDLEPIRNTFTEVIVDFLSVFGAINYLLQHPEDKDIKRKQKRSKPEEAEKDSKETKPAANSDDTKSVEPKIINLNGISVNVSKNKVANALKSRKIVYSVDCWNVRGHYRHYKNGKTIFIKSYEKGKKRNSGSHTNSTYYEL